MNLADQLCFNHPDREVAVRCLECGRFYCRECAGEYQDRFLCSSCLTALQKEAPTAGSSLLGRLQRVAGLLIGVLCCWLVFYGLGQLLYVIPSAMHAGFIQHEEDQ